MARGADDGIEGIVERESSRLRGFIRRRVPDSLDAEDILQDVLFELAEANRLLMPIEHVTSWLFRVARNRITDLFRRKRPERLGDAAAVHEDGESLGLEDLLPSQAPGPEDDFERGELLDALEEAIDALPEEPRAVFVAHEIEGRSFRELSETTGVNVNTLLSRKHYAVLRLRDALGERYGEGTKGRRTR